MTRPRSFAEAVELRAHADADGELIRLAGGTALSAGALLDRAHRPGGTRSRRSPGPATSWRPPCRPAPRPRPLTTALSWLGAVELPLPDGLDPAVAPPLASSTGCVTAVVAPERLGTEPHLAALGDHPARPVLTVGGAWRGPAPTSTSCPARPTPAHRADLDAPAAVMVTSGTGGRPKGALLPNGAGLGQAERVRRAMEYDAYDVLLNVFAWQHVNARHAAFLPAVLSGARLVVDTFSVSRFWSTVAREDVTAFNFMGAVCAMLLRQPAADRPTGVHSVRQAYGGPAPAWLHRGARAVRRRVAAGLRVHRARRRRDHRSARSVPGAAGRVVPEYGLRVVDEHGAPVGRRQHRHRPSAPAAARSDVHRVRRRTGRHPRGLVGRLVRHRRPRPARRRLVPPRGPRCRRHPAPGADDRRRAPRAGRHGVTRTSSRPQPSASRPS